jgi:hypothetical protein
MHLMFNEAGRGGPVRISAEDAAKRSRERSVNRSGVDIYGSDEDALHDFIMTHWAWVEPGGGPPAAAALSLGPVEDPCP